MLLNRAQANAMMDEQGLDALVATTFENITYATGYVSEAPRRNRRTQFYGLVPRSADPVLILPAVELCVLADEALDPVRTVSYGVVHVNVPSDAGLSPQEARWLDLMRHSPNYPSAVAALAGELRLLGLERGRIALDTLGMLPELRLALQEQLPELTIVEGTQILRQVRMIKTAPEVERIRQAARVNEEALSVLIEMCQPGVTSAVLASHYREHVTRAGAVPGLWTTLGGAQSSGFFRPDGTPLQAGDLVRFDVGCSVGNYWSDMGRTVCLRRSSPREDKAYAALRAGYEAAIAKIRPGVAASEIHHTAVKEIQAHGLTEFDRHHCGHGIGVEFYELPMIAPDDHTPLAPGMVINVEVPYYELGFGGLQLEDTFLVTDTGCQPLTTLPRDLIIT